MKIQREINGVLVEIELTNNELYKAYREHENSLDRGECFEYVECMEEYCRLSKENQKEFIIFMADCYRGHLIMDNWHISHALYEAFQDACNKFINK